MEITVKLQLNERTLKFLESEGYTIIAEKAENREHPKILQPEEAKEEIEKEATVRRIGKDLDITFGDQLEAEDWRNQFADMLEKEGYHLSREKPETIQAEAAASES